MEDEERNIVAAWQADIKASIERGEFTTMFWPKGYGKTRFAREVEEFETFLREIGHHPEQQDDDPKTA